MKRAPQRETESGTQQRPVPGNIARESPRPAARARSPDASIGGPFDPKKFGIEERAIRTGHATLPNSAPNRSRPISKEARGQRKACLKSSPPENAFGIAHGRAHPAQQDFVALGLRNAPRHAARPQPTSEGVSGCLRISTHLSVPRTIFALGVKRQTVSTV